MKQKAENHAAVNLNAPNKYQPLTICVIAEEPPRKSHTLKCTASVFSAIQKFIAPRGRSFIDVYIRAIQLSPLWEISGSRCKETGDILSV